jgi:hypothetical protein
MRAVHVLEAFFVPSGLLARAISPFVDAALCLIRAYKLPEQSGVILNPTTVSTRAIIGIGIGEKCSRKVIPSSSSFLNHKILIAF